MPYLSHTWGDDEEEVTFEDFVGKFWADRDWI
jgi:hypothetical protein